MVIYTILIPSSVTRLNVDLTYLPKKVPNIGVSLRRLQKSGEIPVCACCCDSLVLTTE